MMIRPFALCTVRFAVLALTITSNSAMACGTYKDFGSLYVFVEQRDDLSEDDRLKCKIGAIGAMLCVSAGYLTQRNAGALVAEVLRDAGSSDDPRLKCMGRQLSQQLHGSRAHIRLKPGLKKSDFYARGRQRFGDICGGENLHGHFPFGVRVFGPGKTAAVKCHEEIGSVQD